LTAETKYGSNNHSKLDSPERPHVLQIIGNHLMYSSSYSYYGIHGTFLVKVTKHKR